MSDILEVRNVVKKYPKFTLDDFSFTIPSGCIVGFIGRNGAGKTTTLKGIMNLLRFDSGEVFFMGQDMKVCELDAKQNIGFSLSEINYYPNKKIKTIVKVVSQFYKSFDQTKFNHLCELFDLDVEKKLQQLSSGMKVKYSLSLALSHGAKLLILDEPTSGLDPISRDEILDIFVSLVENNDVSILFSTHITSDLDKCADRILYIKDGKKMYEGTKDDFISQYYVVRGAYKDLSSSLKDRSLSFKKQSDEFSALINRSDEQYFKDLESVTIKEPDLEEIMVFLERGKNHEEFIL